MSSITSFTSSFINSTKFKGIDISKLSAHLHSLTADTFEKSTGDAIFSRATFEKAKDMVIKTILGSNPKESCVLINDDKIIYQAVGAAHEVGFGDEKLFSLLDNPKNKIALIHSHPTMLKNGSSHPVSYGDFVNLNAHQAERSIYAINSLGEYSMLQKQGNTRPSIFKVKEYERKYENELIDALTGEDKELLRKHWTAPSGNHVLTQEEIKKLEQEYEELRNKESVVCATRDATHNFWLKYASELGVRYDTNFSCFK